VAKSLADRLVEAASFASAESVRALLAKGASANAVDRSGTTALYAASLRQGPEIAETLLAAGADPNVESAGEGEGPPLCAAAAWGYSTVVAVLLAHGANPDQRED
jgi:ankyrin repeat protein